mgnify:CR=1 FL=1
MEQNTVNTTAVYEALQELDNEVKDCMSNIEEILSSCSTIENCYTNFLECNGATLKGYPTTKSEYTGNGITITYTENYTFETTSSVDIADVSANIKKYLENANEELESLSQQITNGYSIMDEIATYNKQVEDNLHMSFEEYSHLFDKNLVDHLWKSSDVVGDNDRRVKITDNDKQWWTDDNLAFEYNPSGNGIDAWIVYQVVDGKKVAMGWTDTKTAAAYSKEALNMLKKNNPINEVGNLGKSVISSVITGTKFAVDKLSEGTEKISDLMNETSDSTSSNVSTTDEVASEAVPGNDSNNSHDNTTDTTSTSADKTEPIYRNPVENPDDLAYRVENRMDIVVPDGKHLYINGEITWGTDYTLRFDRETGWYRILLKDRYSGQKLGQKRYEQNELTNIKIE